MIKVSEIGTFPEEVIQLAKDNKKYLEEYTCNCKNKKDILIELDNNVFF